MEAIRIEATVQPNGRVILNDLPFEEGKQVEIIVLDSNGIETAQKLNPLKGSVLRYDDPFEPAAPIEDWEVLDHKIETDEDSADMSNLVEDESEE